MDKEVFDLQNNFIDFFKHFYSLHLLMQLIMLLEVQGWAEMGILKSPWVEEETIKEAFPIFRWRN